VIIVVQSQMARAARLKATYLPSHVAWSVNVPPNLSDTGKRRQLFFETKRDAIAECEKLKARKDNFGVSLTAMTPARIAEASEAYKLIDPLNVGLLSAVRDYIAGHKLRNESISFVDLFNLYLEAKSDRNDAYLRELRITRDRMPQLHDRLVCDIGVRELEPILNAMAPGARNPVMRYLRAVFNYGVKRGYVTENPIARLDFADRPRREVVTVPSDQVVRMLNHAFEEDLELLPFLIFGFFSGIRPEGELMKLEWTDVKLDASEIVVRPEVSKTKRRRFIDLSANARAWLNAYVDRGGITSGRIVKFAPSELRTHRTANWQTASDAEWPQQGMRHTFCSNWLAIHKDINRLVLMSGHDSVDTMWRAYHAGIPEAEANKFWSILPPASEDRKIVQLPAAV
jgi:integrase/recombinase XerD